MARLDVARAYAPGHIGSTPQNTELIALSRITGMLHDFSEHIPPKNRVDAYLPLPPVAQAAQPGYFRDQSTVAHIDESVWLSELAPNNVTAKNIGGPNLFGDD